MIKLIPCPKITKRELMTALMEGRTFAAEQPIIKNESIFNVIHWDDNYGDCPVRCGTKPWGFRGFKYLCEITESHWYDDPNARGKPVKVRNHISKPWTIAEFNHIAINQGDVIFVTEANCYEWIYCEPVTAADLYQEPV